MNEIEKKVEFYRQKTKETEAESYRLQHEKKRRKIKVISQELTDDWSAYQGDNIEVMKGLLSDSVHYSIFSPPFMGLFVYSSSERDMGNSTDSEFFDHFAFFIPELYRVMMPGRLASFHCMNLPMTINSDGFIGMKDFRGDLIRLFVDHGFIYHSEVCIWKDPLVQATRTKMLPLAHKQISKDSSRCAMGYPDYIVTMRKPGENPEPIAHGRGFEEYVGERPEPRKRKNDDHAKNKYSQHVWQRYASPVWFDIRQTNTLNVKMAREKEDERHVCLARGSLILTKEKGFKPIQQIEIGDRVLTHKGRWRSVLAVQNTGIQQVIDLKAQGVPGLLITPNHGIWARSVRNIPWAKAHSRQDAKNNNPKWISAIETIGKYINTKLPSIEFPLIKDIQYWWVVGRWLADGHIDQRNGAIISCGKYKWEYFVKNVGEYGGNSPRNNRTCYQILLRDPEYKLRSILKRCGNGADQKHLPPEAYTLPPKFAKALLDGYLSGDGYYLEDRNRWLASSISKELLLGLSILAQRVYNTIASIYPGRPAGTTKIEGRTVNTKQDWIFCFDIPNKNRANKLPFIVSDGAWKKVRSADIIKEKIETWNIRVQEDESFTTEGCIVKNCPLQLDVIARCLELWTNKNDVVLSPFAGIGSEGYQSLLMDRKFIGIELKKSYYGLMVKNLRSVRKSRIGLGLLRKKI